MKSTPNKKAMDIALVPAVMIPTMHLLQRLHAPDYVVGTLMGVTIGGMILLLISSARDKRAG